MFQQLVIVSKTTYIIDSQTGISSGIGVIAKSICGAPDKPCGVGRADANPKLLLNDT